MAGDPEEAVTSNAASPDDIRGALSSLSDPDVIAPGSTQATTTVEAQNEARKILKRVGEHDTEANQLRKDIENNAEASRQALKRAQQILMQNSSVMFPSERELAARSAAALMRPNPGVGMAGAPLAMGANYQAEEAAQEEEARKAIASYMNIASGLPLQQQLAAINEKSISARQKLIEMQNKYDAELGRGALTMMGRMVANPAAQAAQKPNSQFGKQALDVLGDRAYNKPGDPSSGFSPAYHDLVKTYNDTAIAEAKARAGTDNTPMTPAELFENANLAGVPVQVIGYGAPDTSHMSTKQRNNYLQNEQKTADKEFANYGAEDEQLMKALRNLDQFQQLNKGVATGPSIAPIKIGGVHAGPHGAGAELGTEGGINVNPFSIAAHFRPSVQEMDKIAADTVSQVIPSKGFGRVTNRDLGLFQSAMIGTDKAQPTNDSIIAGLRIMINNNLERHKFEQAYYGIHQTLKGATNAWEDYLQHNDIFDHSQPFLPNGLKPLNPNRMPWQEYFKGKNGAAPEELDSVQAEEPADVGPPLTSAELHGADPNDPLLKGLTREQKISATTPAQARGGRVGMAEGGTPPSQPDPEVRDGLNALINGLTFRVAGQPENADSPMTNFLGEAGGATASTLAALAALRRPARLARMMSEHPHLTAAAAGATAGGVAGEMGEGEPWEGAAAGAMLGPMLRGGSRLGFNASANALDRLRGQLIPSGVRRSIGAIEADTGGDWQGIADRLQSDAKAKVPSIMGEIGPRSQGLTHVALTRDTPETNALTEQLQSRQANAPERVHDQVNNALAPDPYLQKTEELREALYQNAKPMYDAAFKAFPAVKTTTLSQIMNTPSGQEAAARAFRMMQDQRLPIGAPDVTGMVQNPSLQYLDQIKRALDDMIISEEGAGATYQATQQGRILRQMRSSLVDELDKATVGPQGQPSPYRAARDQYAGDLDVMDALRTGRENFDKLTAEDVQALMGKLDFSSKDAFRSGVAEGIFQRIAGLGQDQNAAQKIIGNPKLQAKIAPLFDDPKQAQQFIANLQRESAIFSSGQMLAKQGVKGQLTSMTPKSIPQMVRNHLMTNATAGDVADTMSLTPNDPMAKEKLARLREQADRLRSRGVMSNMAGTAGAAGLTVAGTPSVLSQPQGQ